MQVKKHKRRRYAAPIGGLFLVMAAIGIVTVVIISLNLTGKVLDNSTEKEMFEEFIQPVLMFDPVPFEDPADISNDRLLLYSMWAHLLANRDRYDFNSGEAIQISKSDLDVAAHTLFYTQEPLVLEHRTFGDYLSEFYFDETSGLYSVPVSAELYVYSPRVLDIARVGNYYRLYVGYIPPGTAWTTIVDGGKQEPDPDKYMYYFMVKNGTSYQIAKVEDINAEAPPSHSYIPEEFENPVDWQSSAAEPAGDVIAQPAPGGEEEPASEPGQETAAEPEPSGEGEASGDEDGDLSGDDDGGEESGGGEENGGEEEESSQEDAEEEQPSSAGDEEQDQ